MWCSRDCLSFIAVLTLAAGSGAAAMACEGQGVQFEEGFDNMLGGWDTFEVPKIADGRQTYTFDGQQGYFDMNAGFVFENGDICAEATWPQGEAHETGAGLAFWGQDYDNYYLFEAFSTGKYALYRKLNGSWVTLQAPTSAPTAGTGDGAPTVIRIRADGNKAKLFLDGQELVEFRGQPPKAWKIGTFAECLPQECTTTTVSFDNIKVTDLVQ